MAFLVVWLAASWVMATTLTIQTQDFETSAKHALLIDMGTGTLIYEKDADARMPPASMAKLMTTAVVFDAIAEGRLDLDDEFVVSENAWRTGGAPARGSTMFAELGSSIRVEDLIRGMIIQSGNDSCIILAEGMAGTEAQFAELMNQTARRLGLEGSRFTNSTGLPDPEQHVTARDLATLAKYLIETYPDFYKIFSEPDFTWNGIFQRNRNPLLDMNIGADGLKTGYTDAAGYGLVGSTVRDRQRLLVVIAGAATDKERANEARKLIEWGYRAFERVMVFGDGEVIAETRVFGGDQSRVGVISNVPVDLLLPVGTYDLIKAQVVYQGPVRAPVEAGQRIGTLIVTTGQGLTRDAPVVAATNIGVGGTWQRALDGLEELLLGWW